MSNFVGRTPFLKFAMGCHRNPAISHSPNQFFFRTPSFPIQGVQMNNLAPMKNCPGGRGVQGNLNWMPGYYSRKNLTLQSTSTPVAYLQRTSTQQVTHIPHMVLCRVESTCWKKGADFCRAI